MITFLVIEDDLFSKTLLQYRIVKDFGEDAVIHSCAYMKQADQILELHAIDLVFLDIHLPDSDYLGALGFIERHPEVPVVVMTSEMNPDFLKQCLKMGAKECLPKTFDSLLHLKKHIRKAMEP